MLTTTADFDNKLYEGLLGVLSKTDSFQDRPKRRAEVTEQYWSETRERWLEIPELYGATIVVIKAPSLPGVNYLEGDDLEVLLRKISDVILEVKEPEPIETHDDGNMTFSGALPTTRAAAPMSARLIAPPTEAEIENPTILGGGKWPPKPIRPSPPPPPNPDYPKYTLVVLPDQELRPRPDQPHHNPPPPTPYKPDRPPHKHPKRSFRVYRLDEFVE